jgi:uncharacterized membrane protein YhaH (DUF805 family)
MTEARLALDPIQRFAAFMLLLGLTLSLACLACLSWRMDRTWPAVREGFLATSTLLFALWLVRKTPRPRLFRHEEDEMPKKPFQFSMRRMFATVTIVCVEVGLFSFLVRRLDDANREGIVASMFLVVGTSAIAAGVVLRKPLAGALWGLAAFIAVLAWVFLRAGHS